MVEYKPLLDRALELSPHQPEHVVVLQRPQAEAALTAPRDLDWPTLMADGGAGRVACRSRRPTRSTCSTRRGTTGEAQGRGPRQRRARRRAALVDGQRLRRRPRRRVVDRLRRRLGGRPLLHRLRAAARRCDDGALRGQAGGDPGRRRVLAGRRRVRRAGAVHRAHRDPGGQEGGPRRAPARARTTSRRCAPCSSPASGSTPTPGSGRPSGSACRRRPLVADRDRLADRGQPARARADADQAGLADGAGARLRRAGARPVRGGGASRAPRERSASGCRCRPGHPADAVGRRRRGSSRPTCPPSTATTSPATAATWTRTATCS